MRIAVLGGGPSGLYFAYLMKKRFPAYRIHVREQNARDVTFGFGVVLSGRAMTFLSEGDSALVDRLAAVTESWSDQHFVHRGEQVVIDGSRYSGIARIAMLKILQEACIDAGVEIAYGVRSGPEIARDYDVLVGADGANSVLRDSHTEGFGTRVVDLQNYFAWYGVQRPYPAHTLTFVQSDLGVFCGHHYRYTPGMSTFVAEVDARTFAESGMHAMDDDARRRLTEQVFAETLGRQPLVSNKSNWRRWRLVKNDRWSHGNIVLIGDALRTAHPSIGSGTRLAMEDSIALARAFTAGGTDIAAIFRRYEETRKPVREKLNRAAELSIDWYERMGEKMGLAPHDLAYDYMLRTGVMSVERLERDSPQFMARCRAAQPAAVG